MDIKQDVLKSTLQKIQKEKLSRYTARTEHLEKGGSPTYINRLIREDSPYLVLRAHNPVNWYAWGDEAFVEEKRKNKPIFLSIAGRSYPDKLNVGRSLQYR